MLTLTKYEVKKIQEALNSCQTYTTGEGLGGGYYAQEFDKNLIKQAKTILASLMKLQRKHDSVLPNI